MTVTVTDIVAALRESVYGPTFNISTGFNQPRIPFLFTSRKRLGILAPNNFGSSGFRATTTGPTTDVVSDKISSTPAQPSLASDPKIIAMAVNPDSINWRQAKRITRKDTMDGAVFFHFNNSRGQDNDIITMDMKGVTGNINLNESNASGSANTYREASKSKLLIWHNLFKLTREEMLFQDQNNTSTDVWYENEMYIVYTTKLFPMGIRLAGFFSAPLQFQEDAKDPNLRHYSLSFTVTDTMPSLDDIGGTLRDWLQARDVNAAMARRNLGI